VLGPRGILVLGGDLDQLGLGDRLGVRVLEDVLLVGAVAQALGHEARDVRAAHDLVVRAGERLARLDLVERLAL
jgi:hypothetical protein